MTTCESKARRCLALIAATLCAATAFAAKLSGFYDPAVENAWTLVVTGNGTETAADDPSAVTNKAYGLISDAKGWVCKVQIVNAAEKTLKFGIGAGDLYKVWPETEAARQLDLSGTVARGSETWTLAQISNAGSDFMQKDGSGNLIKLSLFRAPKTLTSFFLKPFFGNSGNYQNTMETLILDCPLLTSSGIANDKFGTYMTALKYVYFNLPTDTAAFGLVLNASTGKLSGTDVSDWNLNSTPTLSNTSLFTDNFAGTGVLRFPSVTAVPAGAFVNSALTGLVIGTNKTAQTITIGASAAAGASLTNVVLGGGSCSFAIDTNAFACANLARVTLNGGVPAWTNEGLVFGTQATAARTMVFAVEKCDAWTTVMLSDAVTPLTAAERADYAAAHPGETVPYGVAAASVFRTAAEQYVAYPRFVEFALLGTPVGQGSAKVYNANHEEIVAGAYYPDEIFGELTLEATPASADDAFAEWEGIVSRTAVRENPLTFTYDATTAGLTIVPRFNHTWLYAPGEIDGSSGKRLGTLTQGDWTLNCYESDAENRRLTLGLPDAEASLFASASGTGCLDLTGKICASHLEEWTIVSPGTAFGYATKALAEADAGNLRRITVLYLPTTLTSALPRACYNWTFKNAILDKFVMDCPNISGTLGKWYFRYFKAQNWVLRLPMVTALADDVMASGSVGGETDFSLWNLASVTTLGKYSVDDSSTAGGALAFPSVRQISTDAFYNTLGAEKIVFGRETDKTGGLETIAASAVSGGAAKLKELVFSSKRSFTVGRDAFAGSPSLSKVTVLGRPIDATSLSNLVSSVAAASDKTCSIYVSPKLHGTDGSEWSSLIDPNLTADEEAFRPASQAGCRFLGVIDNPVRNCWVFGISSPYDPKGLAVIFR